MLENFNAKKQKLLDAYARLAKSGLVFSDGLDENTLKDRASKLENEEFILAIAGQMKAGKSTLLNALVFGGEPILPADDTPLTAKITEIRYAKQPKLKANFYSKSEWETLKTYKDENGREFFKNDIVPTIKDKSIEVRVLGTSKEDKIENLGEYVANKGLYTPFVKTVQIYHPSEILRQLIVVDTPGTNDSNKFRSQVTLDWIGRCDAAIYASYAGRMLDENDYKFITNYLLHLASSKRIIAVNKIDTANSEEEVKSDLERIKQDDKFKDTIFNDKSKFVLTAALADVIKFKEKIGKLDEDDEFYKKKLVKKGFYENSRVEELRELVAKKLVENKGDDLIASHTDFIMQTFERKKREIDDRRASLQNALNVSIKSNEEIEASIKKIEANIEKIYRSQDELADKFDEGIKEVQGEIEEATADKFTSIRNALEEKLNGYKSINDIRYRIEWDVKNALEDNAIFKEIAKVARKSLEKNIEDFKCDVIVKFGKITGFDQTLIENRVNHKTFTSVKDMQDQVSALAISNRTVENALSDSTWFWQVWFDTQKGQENYKAKLSSAIQDNLAKIQNIVKDRIKNAVSQNADEFINGIKTAMRECEEENRKLYEEISVKGQLKSTEVAAIKERIKDIKLELEGLDKFKNEIETEIK